jgi:serine O-acetyltransferase
MGLSHRPATERVRPVRDALAADLRHMVEPATPGGGGPRWRLRVLVMTALMPRVRTVVFYRFGQVLAGAGLLPLAYALAARGLRASGAELHPSASIGPGLCLMHSSGIVVGHQVRTGRGLRLYQGVTLGDGSRPGQPVLGDDVTVGAGACVLGPVRVGDRVVIGANAVVTRDLPDDVVATGAPATWRARTAGVRAQA